MSAPRIPTTMAPSWRPCYERPPLSSLHRS
jgi:hypothetical protein